MPNTNQVIQTGELANITVFDANGKAWNYGKPTDRFHKQRARYINWRRGLRQAPDGTWYSTKEQS